MEKSVLVLGDLLGYGMSMTYLHIRRIIRTISRCGHPIGAFTFCGGLTCALFTSGCDCAGSTSRRGR